MQIWSLSYALQVRSARYTNVVYIGLYLVLTYRERLFSTVWNFLNCFSLSLNCMCRVSKFQKRFCDILGNWELYLRVFSFVIYGKFNSNFSVFISFFHVICLGHFLSRFFLLVSKLYELSPWFRIFPKS